MCTYQQRFITIGVFVCRTIVRNRIAIGNYVSLTIPKQLHQRHISTQAHCWSTMMGKGNTTTQFQLLHINWK